MAELPIPDSRWLASRRRLQARYSEVSEMPDASRLAPPLDDDRSIRLVIEVSPRLDDSLRETLGRAVGRLRRWNAKNFEASRRQRSINP